MYAFKCGKDSKIKINGVSKSFSKNINFEEYKKCLDGEEYQFECDVYLIGSLHHEMYLQKVIIKPLFSFDDIRCFENKYKNETLEIILLNGCKNKRKVWKDRRCKRYLSWLERNVR